MFRRVNWRTSEIMYTASRSAFPALTIYLQVFSSAYIRSHAERFLYLNWIDPVALRNFLVSVVADENAADVP